MVTIIYSKKEKGKNKKMKQYTFLTMLLLVTSFGCAQSVSSVTPNVNTSTPRPAGPALTPFVASTTAPAPTVVATPTVAPVVEAPKTLEERVVILEQTMAKVVEVINQIAANAVSIEAARGLATDVVSLQDQIISLRRSMIPPPTTKPAKVTSKVGK